MILIAYVFGILMKVKYLVKPMSKKRRFRWPFDSQPVKGFQTLLNSPWDHFYHMFSWLWGKMTWKMSLLAIWEILGVFVNTLTADDKYSLRNSENLLQPIQMQ